MRDAGISIPVIFLTVLSDDIYKQAALEGGAVDFIDKARRLPILLRRLQLIAQGGRSAPEPEPPPRATIAAVTEEEADD
jgi:two-component system response regulator ChvI